MKKYLLGFIALVMAISFSAFTESHKPVKFDTTDWYQVDHTTQKTISATPYLSNMDRSQAVLNGGCDDDASLFCLVGSSSPVAAETPASNFNDDFRIKESDTK